MHRHRFLHVAAAAVLAALINSPARAGEYVFDQTNSSSTGTVTLSLTDPSDYGYPGYTHAIGSPMLLDFNFKHGSVTWNGTETLQFHWVPSTDPMTGLPDPNDVPPADGDVWTVSLPLAGGLGYPSQYEASVAGSGSLSWSASCGNSSTSYSETASGTPDSWDYNENDEFVQTSFYSFPAPEASGDPSPEFEFLLTGTDPTVEVHWEGSGSASGDINLQATAPTGRGNPARAEEAIRHTTPVANAKTRLGNISSSATVTPAGWWQGRTTRSYQVALWWTGPSNTGGGPFYTTPFTTGTGGHVSWTSLWPFTIIGNTGSVYTSTAILYYQVNPTTGTTTHRSDQVRLTVVP